MTTMLAAFFGAWELSLIAAMVGLALGLPLAVIAIVLFIVKQRNKDGVKGTDL